MRVTCIYSRRAGPLAMSFHYHARSRERVSFEGSALWRVRQKVGHDLLLWPGATVLLEDADGRILLGLRRDNGEWTMPGGGAEEGGSFAATALDELREEVGLEADATDLVAFACVSEPDDHLIRYPNGDFTHYFGIGRWSSPEPPIG